MIVRPQPSRARSIILIVVGAIVILVESAAFAIFIAEGKTQRQPLGFGLLPVIIIAYGVYLIWSSVRNLRARR